MTALFDDPGLYCIEEGWALLHRHPSMGRWRLRCWLGRHDYPVRRPSPANGFSPSNYDHCHRCHAAVHWFVVGQHRWGGIARWAVDA